MMRQWLLVAVVLAVSVVHVSARRVQQDTDSVSVDPIHKAFDELLDLNVRDGLVYYRALRLERGKLDQYIVSLDAPAIASAYPKWSREQQIALWLNAYNAFVLETVINRYPIRGRAPEYPSDSIRQIPGAFDRIPHRAAGRTMTLDNIENTILASFADPRLLLGLGRGALGSTRLRSEAFSAARLESQLTQAATEFATTSRFIQIDRLNNRLSVSPLISWHQDAFVAAYASRAPKFSNRSPIERAVLGFIDPNLRPAEREFLDKNEFQLAYQDFDWHLNDLTRRP